MVINNKNIKCWFVLSDLEHIRHTAELKQYKSGTLRMKISSILARRLDLHAKDFVEIEIFNVFQPNVVELNPSVNMIGEIIDVGKGSFAVTIPTNIKEICDLKDGYSLDIKIRKSN